MEPGDHVKYEHKSHMKWGIVRELVSGLFGEPRAVVEWIDGYGSPFPVPVESLTPDRVGVVRGTLAARRAGGS